MDAPTAPVINLCAGPGGWEEGARRAGLNLDILGFDISSDAIATAEAAGHRRARTDIRHIAPSTWDGVTGLIASAPCPSFSSSGLRSGLRDYQQVLDVWTSLGWGIPVDDALSCVAGVEDPRTALLALAGTIALGVETLDWVAFEQVPQVEHAWEDLAAELFSVGWEYVDVATFDMADHGAPSRRRRSYLLGKRTRPGRHLALQEERVSMADALGWAPGHRVITRGDRKPTGGNTFSADGPAWCLTGSARTWERDDGLRLTDAEAGVLVGFPADYPWQGSRTSRFLQSADAVSPVAAAAILGAVAHPPKP